MLFVNVSKYSSIVNRRIYGGGRFFGPSCIYVAGAVVAGASLIELCRHRFVTEFKTRFKTKVNLSFVFKTEFSVQIKLWFKNLV